MRLPSLAALAVGGALLGCTDRPATQIIVRVDSDMSEGTELLSVTVNAFFEGSPEQPIIRAARFDLVDGGYGLPGELSLVPRSPDEPRRLFVTVTGDTPAGPVTQRSRVSFEAGRKLVMVMYLARSCRTTTCGAEETCGNDGRCRREDQPPLAVYESPDASVIRSDGATVTGRDGALSDRPDVGTDGAVDAPPDTTAARPDGAADAGGDGGAQPDRQDIATDGAAPNPFPSTGAEGPFPPADAGALVTLTSGIHHFTTLHVPRHMRVVSDGEGVLDLRATGPVLIEGTIDLGGGGGGYEGSGAGAQGGCAACGAMTVPTVRTRVMGVGGAGVEGGTGSDGTRGGRFGGGTGAYIGSGGGGGGYAGGGGGYGNGAVGGAGASFVEMSGAEAGGVGGGASRVEGGGGGGDLEAPLHVYRGGDGSPSPTGCPSVAGGGGGGSIGRGAVLDLGLRTYFRGGSGGGGGGGGPRARGGGGAGGGGGGGGALRIASPVSIEVARGATLLASGGNGGRGDQSDPAAVVGSGGGGSGGVIDLVSPTVTISGSLSVAGGAGGAASTSMCRGAGGAGGLGRIRLMVDPSRCQVDGGLIPPMPEAGCVPSPPQGRPGEVYIGRWPD